MSESAENLLYWRNESLTAETQAEREHASDMAMAHARFLLDARCFSAGDKYEGRCI